MSYLSLDIVTPGRDITGLEASEVTVPGEAGEMTFLPDHTEIVSSLNEGRLVYKTTNGKTETLLVKSGFVQVEANKIIVITESVETQ